MRIIVNGEKLEVASGLNLLTLLDHIGKPAAHVAVEHNGEVLDRDIFAQVTLGENDQLEVVHFVGGG
jgi:thiamine biosynthesis protein ThiS